MGEIAEMLGKLPANLLFPLLVLFIIIVSVKQGIELFIKISDRRGGQDGRSGQMCQEHSLNSEMVKEHSASLKEHDDKIEKLLISDAKFEQRLNRMEAQTKKMEKTLESMDENFDKVNNKLDLIASNMNVKRS